MPPTLPTPAAPKPPSTARAILLAGLLAGALDISGAVIHFLAAGGKDPARLFYYIASAVFGHDTAYAGGWVMIGCGLLFHFLVAYAFTVLFFTAYPRIPLLAKNVAVTAIVYGLFVWTVMNFIVLPLTRVPKPKYALVPTGIGIAILMVCIGLPISLMARRHFARRK